MKTNKDIQGLSDEQINQLSELHFYAEDAATMDIRLHRFARAVIAAQPSTAQGNAPDTPEGNWPKDFRDVIKGAEEAAVRAYIASQDDAGYDATVTILRRTVDLQNQKIIELEAAMAAQSEKGGDK